jgi:effector-binding domain-containing protein
MKRMVWLALLAAIILLAVFAPTLAPIVSRTAEPDFTIEKQQGAIEFRRYAPMVVAEVETTGDREAAINAGFRLLADFIFGNNAPNEKIAMTVPVTQRSGENIAMTAPVTQQASDGKWHVRFVMPKQYTKDSLPKPNNPKVKIIAESERRFVVIRFSGSSGSSNIAKHQAELDAFIKASNLTVTGPPVIAFYNPPWTIPIFKRNEVMYEIAPRT